VESQAVARSKKSWWCGYENSGGKARQFKRLELDLKEKGDEQLWSSTTRFTLNMSIFTLCTRFLRQSTPRATSFGLSRQLHTPTIASSTSPRVFETAVRSQQKNHINTTSRTPAGAQSATTTPPPPPADKLLEKYTVQRTPTRNLPIYQLAKAGGNLKMTKVRKLGGDTEALRKQLEGFLEPTPEYVRINHVTGHIMIKVS